MIYGSFFEGVVDAVRDVLTRTPSLPLRVANVWAVRLLLVVPLGMLSSCGQAHAVYYRNAFPFEVSLSGNCSDEALFISPGEVRAGDVLGSGRVSCDVQDPSGKYLGCAISGPAGRDAPFEIRSKSLESISSDACVDKYDGKQ